MFEIAGKVALITGGASGIGFVTAKELLRNGLKACTLADINEAVGQEAVDEITQEFGSNKAIFFKTDVFEKAQFEAAFQATVETFKNVDILVNNAAILDDSTWERTIQINVQGSINGILLGLDNYLQHHRSGTESVIVNLASIAGLDPFISFPIYSCSKSAIIGLTRAFGAEQHYERSKVKVVAVCPGITDTPMVAHEVVVRRSLAPSYIAMITHDLANAPHQPSECVAKAVVHIIKEGKPRSVWVAEGSEPPYEIAFHSRQARRKQ